MVHIFFVHFVLSAFVCLFVLLSSYSVDVFSKVYILDRQSITLIFCLLFYPKCSSKFSWYFRRLLTVFFHHRISTLRFLKRKTAF